VTDELAGVVLAAGAGSRLSPLSRWRPKALCPVGAVPLVDLALARVAGCVGEVAVNLHHGADQLEAHLAATPGDAVHRSREEPEALGTAGALGALAPWIDGRPVLVTNADAWLGSGIVDAVERLVAGWDGVRHRLLCVRDPARGDFGDLRYCGVALLPAGAVAALRAVPSGLYEVAWRAALAAGELDVVEATVPFVDCGTPADYLAANLAASGGRSVVDGRARLGRGAVLERCVVWDGAEVRPGERLVDAVRTSHGTVLVRPTAPRGLPATEGDVP